MKKPRITKTDSISELAELWDTHDLADFEDPLDEVADPVFDRQTVIPLHLEASEAASLSHIAKAKGLAAEELVHEWVREKLFAS
jgi:hypothetical protein